MVKYEQPEDNVDRPRSTSDTKSENSEARISSVSTLEIVSPDPPEFNLLNPYAWRKERQKSKHWEPIPNLTQTLDSIHLKKAVWKVLQDVHTRISPEELEKRAYSPEYRVAEIDVVSTDRLIAYTVSAVGRVPRSLLRSPQLLKERSVIKVTGWLLKKGENLNKSYRRRFMELKDTTLRYYKEPPLNEVGVDKKKSLRGLIDLSHVLNLQLSSRSRENYAIEIVTATRTWMLAAENEADFHKWLGAICRVVRRDAIGKKIKRILNLKDGNTVTSTDVGLCIATGDAVSDIVESIFIAYEHSPGSAPLKPYNPDEYVLKVTGYRDYMVDRDCPIGNYLAVRLCKAQKIPIHLTLVHRSEIDANACRSLSIAMSPGDHSVEAYNRLKMWRGRSSNATAFLSPGMSPDVLDSLNVEDSSSMDSCNVHEALSFRLCHIFNIPKYLLSSERVHNEVKISKKPITSSHLQLDMDLYFGSKCIAGNGLSPINFRLQTTENDNYVASLPEDWMESNLNISVIPSPTKLIFTLLSKDKSNNCFIKLATGGLNLFNACNELQQGVLYVPMLSNLHDCSRGPIPTVVDESGCILQLEMRKTAQIITYVPPLASQPEYQSRKTELIKSGYLEKLGHIAQLSKWRRRWFVLRQETCTLQYFETSNSKIPKGSIDLRNATVLLADEVNRQKTKYLTSSTGSVVNTFSFKLCPSNSNREYYLSADSSHNREEWINAIQHVLSCSIYESSDESNQHEKGIMGHNNSLFSSMVSFSSKLTGPTIPKQTGIAQLITKIMTEPLVRLDLSDEAKLWKNRHEFMMIPEALPRFLLSVDWIMHHKAAEAVELMRKWKKPVNRASYLQLLGEDFPEPRVRSFAVEELRHMPSNVFVQFLPQFVQCLKFEPHDASPLASLLIQRAVEEPSQIGFELFWTLKVESHDEKCHERYGTILNSYLEVCSRKQRAILKLQDKLFSADGIFARICSMVKAREKDGMAEMKRVLREELAILNDMLPSSFQLPIDPRIEVGKIIVNQCKVMSSAKKPLWLVFENAEEGGDRMAIIFKAGDDVRQDCLTLQLIRIMDEVWCDRGFDMFMEPYKCVATSPTTGIVQVVKKAITTADIQRRYGGKLGAYKSSTFDDWIRDNNPDDQHYSRAVDIYMRSMAGYSVATYLLGIGDRHNDNIMISSNGRYFHIDFGHFLGHVKYQFGILRERTSFVLTSEMAHVLGGRNSEKFKDFVGLSCRAFNEIRKHMHLFVSLLELMLPAGMPELTSRDNIGYFVRAISPTLQEDETYVLFEREIYKCLDNVFKRFDNTIHLMAHS